jgi:ankyrin repeat protein
MHAMLMMIYLCQLLSASWNGTLAQVRRLVEEEGVHVDASLGSCIVECCARTALHNAASEGHTKVAAFLVEKQANVYARNDFGDTPLHCACMKGHTKVVELLLDSGANVDAKQEFNRTPLHVACSRGLVEVASVLLSRGADGTAVNQFGQTPLLNVASSRKSWCISLVRMLLEKMAPDAVNIQDDLGRTVLYCINEQV